MRYKHLIPLMPLLFTAVVQAAPNGKSGMNNGSVTTVSVPESRSLGMSGDASLDVQPAARGGGRYGIGYEDRHGSEAGAQRNRGGRVERPERMERAEIERGGRGR